MEWMECSIVCGGRGSLHSTYVPRWNQGGQSASSGSCGGLFPYLHLVGGSAVPNGIRSGRGQVHMGSGPEGVAADGITSTSMYGSRSNRYSSIEEVEGSMEVHLGSFLSESAFLPCFPKFGNNWRYVSIYGGVLSLFVKFFKSKNQVR